MNKAKPTFLCCYIRSEAGVNLHSKHINSVILDVNKSELERKIRETIRQIAYSYKTEETYVHWYKRFVKFNQM